MLIRNMHIIWYNFRQHELLSSVLLDRIFYDNKYFVYAQFTENCNRCWWIYPGLKNVHHLSPNLLIIKMMQVQGEA